MPMGPNLLLTVAARAGSREAVAVVDIGGRRWVVGTFGEVHWVRNLRAARAATVRVDGHEEPVTAVELDDEETTAFFRDVLTDYIRSMPLVWRLFIRTLLRIAAPDVIADPAAAARRLPVFELSRIEDGSAPD